MQLKELKREKLALTSKLDELDAAIDKAEAAGEDAVAVHKEFDAAKARLDVVKRSITRKESLMDHEAKPASEKSMDDEDDTDTESYGMDDDDMDEDMPKKKKGKSMNLGLGLSTPTIIRRNWQSKTSPIQNAGLLVWAQASRKIFSPRYAYNAIHNITGNSELAQYAATVPSFKSVNHDWMSKAAVGPMTTAVPTIVQDAEQGVIEILNAKSVIRSSGARIVQMPQGVKTIFRQNLGGAAAFTSEGSNVSVTKIGMDTIQMSWHGLTALTYATKQELEFPSVNTAELITDDLTNRIALKEDITFLTSTGANSTPVGILSSVNSASVLNSTLSSGEFSTTANTPTWDTISSDLASLEQRLSGFNQNYPFVLYCHPNLVTSLKAVTNGFTFPFREELSRPEPTLNGHRIYTTTQLGATTSGTSPNSTTVGTYSYPLICAKPTQLIVGEAYRYDIQMSTEGSLNDNGTQVNLFGQQLVAWLIASAIDFAMEHDVSASVLNTFGWVKGPVQTGFDQYATTPNLPGTTASSAIPNG